MGFWVQPVWCHLPSWTWRWPLKCCPQGGWTVWPHHHPNLTITLTFIRPPTSEFNPNTEALRTSAHASEAHLRWDPALLPEETQESDSQMKIHLVFLGSATVRQMLMFRHQSRTSSATLAAAPPRVRPDPMTSRAASCFPGKFVSHED